MAIEQKIQELLDKRIEAKRVVAKNVLNLSMPKEN